MTGRLRRRVFAREEPTVIGIETNDTHWPYPPPTWGNPHIYYTSPPASGNVGEEVCLDATHPGPPFRTGGPFGLSRWKTESFSVKGSVDEIYWVFRYTGGFTPSYSIDTLLGYLSLDDYTSSSGDDDAESYGAACWNKFRPTRSGADMGTFLGEIREVPRMLKTTAKGFHDTWKSMGGDLRGFGPKKIANHWLNTQFGWFPFLNDLRNCYKTVKSLDSMLKQLRRDNGQWVKRGGTLFKTEDTTRVLDDPTTCGLFPTLNTYLLSGPPYGSRFADVTVTKEVWFEGRFRYWIPGKPDSWQWNAAAVSMLFGLHPGPSLVWELTPWSWLIDWCADVGDAIANMDSMLFDNLCAKYAYVMGHTMREITYVGTQNLKSSPVTYTWQASAETKQRAEASPFGFGLSPGDFSGRQLSILSALGITRLR